MKYNYTKYIESIVVGLITFKLTIELGVYICAGIPWESRPKRYLGAFSGVGYMWDRGLGFSPRDCHGLPRGFRSL